MTYLSVIIPAYNEAKKIARDLDAARTYLGDKPWKSEVIVVDDGSADHTAQVVTDYVARVKSLKPLITLCSYPRNRGKGFAVRYGVLQAKGSRVAFVDSGLCVPYACLDRGLRLLDEGFDCAIASRRASGTKVVRAQPAHRRLGSQAFSAVVKGIMGVNFVSDTQCGFKVYTSAAAKAIFSRVRTDGFMFDVEALMVAKKLGFRIGEFPVEWANDEDTRYHPVWGTMRNFKELLRIRVRTWASA